MDKRKTDKKDEIILRQLELIRTMSEHNLNRMGSDFWGGNSPLPPDSPFREVLATLGAGIWNAILAGIGYYLQSVVPEDQLMATVSEYSHELGYIFIGLGILIVSYLIYKGRK